MHPWYVLWMVPFLCLGPSRAWLYFSGAVVLSYVEYLGSPGVGLPWWAWLAEYGPLYALLLYEWRAGGWGLAMGALPAEAAEPGAPGAAPPVNVPGR